MATTTKTYEAHERVETNHGAVERYNGCVRIMWRPDGPTPAYIGSDVMAGGTLTGDLRTGSPVVSFESHEQPGRPGYPVLVAVDASRPGLVELADVARRMRDDFAAACKAGRRKAERNGLCPRCGSYCYGDCQANG